MADPLLGRLLVSPGISPFHPVVVPALSQTHTHTHTRSTYMAALEFVNNSQYLRRVQGSQEVGSQVDLWRFSQVGTECLSEEN